MNTQTRRRSAMIGALAIVVAGTATLTLGGALVTPHSIVQGNKFGVADGGEYRVGTGRVVNQFGNEYTSPDDRVRQFIHVPYSSKTDLRGQQIIDEIHTSTDNIVLTKSGEVFAWGDNTTGLIGTGSTQPVSMATKVDLSGTAARDSKVVEISASESAAFARAENGSVVSWGLNDHGQLGQGINDVSAIKKPGDLLTTAVGPVSGVHALATAVLLTDANGNIWGSGESDAVEGTYAENKFDAENVTQPIRAEALKLDGKDIRQSTGVTTRLSEGGWFRGNLVLLETGEVLGWGNPHSGEIASGSARRVRQVPTKIQGPAANTSFKQIALGDRNGMALADNGSVYTWGLNESGQLGTGAGPATSRAGIVDGVNAGASIDAGDEHDLVVLTDGSLIGWGNNLYSQLGLPGDETVLRPTELTASRSGNVTSAAAGGKVSFAVVNTAGALPTSVAPSKDGQALEDAPAAEPSDETAETTEPEEGTEQPADEESSTGDPDDDALPVRFDASSVEATDGHLETLSGTAAPGADVVIRAAAEQTEPEQTEAEHDRASKPSAARTPVSEIGGKIRPGDALGSTKADDDGRWTLDVMSLVADNVTQLEASLPDDDRVATVDVVHTSADDPTPRLSESDQSAEPTVRGRLIAPWASHLAES